MVRAFAYGAVDSGFIQSPVKPLTLRLVFTTYLFDAQYERDGEENKLASLRVVPLGKALSGIPPIPHLGVVER